LPTELTFVPLDFEHKTLADGLGDAGFDAGSAAFFSWLGVVPYLTLDAFRATLSAIGRLPPNTAISFDYVFSPETLPPKRRMVFDLLAGRVAAAGEPFRLFFKADDLEKELRSAGFQRIEQVDFEQLNELYFKDRSDGLRLSPSGVGMLATAWV
jgi:O-methyltransferase involved in polyketide biosynthesis